jgi:hypothetical protein
MMKLPSVFSFINQMSLMKKLRSILARYNCRIQLFVSLSFCSLCAWAQAPRMFNFQGAARDVSGKIIKNAEIGYSFNIHQDLPDGQLVFTNEGTTTTNASGIFNLTIGTAAAPIPDLDWSSKQFYLQVGIDQDGPTNGYTFVDIGTTQLISVPYALYSNEASRWQNDEPIVQTGTLGSSPILPPIGGSGPKLLWYPRKAAFRAGYGSETCWGDQFVGENSFAAGDSPTATGNSSIALGYWAKATADNSIAVGNIAEANAINAVSIGNSTLAQTFAAIAIGYSASATGKGSASLGWGTISKAAGGAAIGIYNDDSDKPTSSVPNMTDRVFQIGNGAAPNNRSNALTVLRKGNVGIGNNALSPQFLLDIGGRARIRHNAVSAGLYFDNSQNVADAFVGLKQDDQIGFYINGGWRFWVDGSAAYVNGAIVNVSDRRLKKDITPFSNSLSLLGNLQGYRYYWKDSQQGSDLQTGLMAQEVEKYFPELVVTGKDGYKAVNYTGLIPHLIEAIKTLDQKAAKLSAMVEQLSSASATSPNASK